MISVRCSLGLFALLLSLSPASQAGVMFNAGADWQWRKGTSEASSPDTTLWRQPEFNDSAWDTGAAPFFYGENLTPGTLIMDMRNNYSTVFLRKRFNINSASQVVAMDLDVRCDDGYMAWINGRPVAGVNFPQTIAYDSFATQAAPEPADFRTLRLNNISPILRDGENVIAIQLFNVSLSSSDIVFDAQLFTIERETEPPVVESVSPFPGTVTSLTEITVTFNEPVVGVDAADLRVNDRSATAVFGSGSVYTFSFPQPEYGSVQVSWSIDANIQDQAVPPNTFEISGPTSRFLYDLLDASFPLVSSVHPPEQFTLRRLEEITVFFTKPVVGVTADDLLINGSAATNVSGTGAGPYVFQFPAQANGTVNAEWQNGHSITDLSSPPRALEGEPWTYQVDSSAPIPQVRINEISAANMTGLLDQDGSAEDWIELYNSGNQSVNLSGWSLTDDEEEPGKWVFPSVSIAPGGYLVIFASGKDVRNPATGRLHTNFKLSLAGEYLGLFTPDAPRLPAGVLTNGFPEQRNDYSYGLDSSATWKYFSSPTPEQVNGASSVASVLAPVHFAVERGFFQGGFPLTLYHPTPGAQIRYTLDGTEPTATSGLLYSAPIQIDQTRMIRAAAFKPGNLPSLTKTHTYLLGQPANRRRIPALSLVTDSQNLYGTTGIMETNPRNTTKHGMAWERPVSVELIRPEDNDGFQIDAGIRVHGGGYVRERYDYRGTSLPFNKYSFRLYFRGDYGATKLEYPLFADIPLDSFDEVVLRAGMNDHSNPYIRDELTRALASDVGSVASHGTFVNLFLNGEYKGIYNPTERIGWKFLQQWHGGGEDWDVIAQSSEIREGDAVAWNSLRNLVTTQSPTVPATYLDISKGMDLVNFIDYLLVHIYADTDDWPHNNWRAGRERTPDGKFRFYIWDAEWSFGYSGSPTRNTITSQLSSFSPPWGGTEIQVLFTRLLTSPEFRLLFADRVHKHYFNGGALTDERIRARYERMRAEVIGTIPGFDDTIGTSWIPQRRRYVTNHFAQSGLLASSNAPVFSQFGGRVTRGFQLEMNALNGTIYYTTNGIDPRPPFSSEPHASAQVYTGPLDIQSSLLVKARTLDGTTWSALSEAGFDLERLGSPLRITEIMYNPLGGEAFEFIEIRNIGAAPVDLGGVTISGIDFRFAEETPPLAGHSTIILANSINPVLFSQRYPGVHVTAYYQGTLSNGGEVLSVQDPAGNILTQVHYDDENGWPSSADGSGFSLELINPEEDQQGLANWQASQQIGGTPEASNSSPSPPRVRLSELMAENISAVPLDGAYPDWVEIHNTSNETVDLANWSLTDDSNPRRFVFPAGTILGADERLVVWCSPGTFASGLIADFALSRAGETLFLYDQNTNRMDAVSWGMQVPDYSIGLTSEGAWALAFPTPGQVNEAAAVASLADVKLNEVLANAAPGEPDWLELHNLNAQLPASIGRCYVGLSNNVSQLAPLSFIPAGGFAVLYADEQSVPSHLLFKIPASGDRLTLYSPSGEAIDEWAFTSQYEGISRGRLPDGTGPWTTFQATLSPGAANYLPEYSGPVINEVLARSGTGIEWLEIRNPNASDFDLGGMSMSLNRRQPGQWQFPTGTVIPADGYLVLTCEPVKVGGIVGADLRIGPGLNDESGGVYLFNPAGQIVEFVEYGFQITDYSIGRNPTTWTLTQSPTPGEANTPTATLQSPLSVRINEWMASPPVGDDWFELYNGAELPIHLGGLYLTDDPSLYGRTNTRIPQLSFIGPRGFVLIQADGETDKGFDHVAFSLSSLGEVLRLYTPTFAVIDEINMLPQLPGVSEGRWPDGASQIRSFGLTPTPGSSNVAPSADGDRDGMPDEWENLYGLDLDVPDGDLDPDGDGVTNLDEYLAGTDPSDEGSNLFLTAIFDHASGGIRLSFTAVQGKSYTLFYRDELGSGEWNRLTNIPAGNETTMLHVLDTSGESTRFYRIITPLQP